MDVGEDTTRGDGNVAEQLVQLLVVADGQLEMTGSNGLLLVVGGGIASEFKDFSRQVLEHGSQVDGGTRTNALGIVALSEETVNTTDGELESGLFGARG